MSLSRNLFKDARFLLIASASGITLFASHLPSEAFDSVFSRPRQAAVQQKVEPARLQISNSDVRSISTVSSAYPATGQTVQTQYQQSTSSASERAKSLYGGQSQTTTQPIQIAPVPQLQSVPQQQQGAQYISQQYGVKPQAQQKYAQAVQQQPAAVQAPQQQPVVTQTAATRSNKRSFFDRFVGKLKGDHNIPEGPPQDPGMRYTPVSKAPSQPPQRLAPVQTPQLTQQPGKFVPPPVPGVSESAPIVSVPTERKAFVPPPVPGVASTESAANTFIAPKTANAPKPRLFPSSESASPVDHPLANSNQAASSSAAVPTSSFIPPMPGSGDEIVSVPKQPVRPQTAALAPAAQNFPELKAIMEGPQVEVPAEKSVVKIVPEESPITIQITEKKQSDTTSRSLQAPKSEAKLPKLGMAVQPTPQVEKKASGTKEIPMVPPATILEVPVPEVLEIPALVETPKPAPSTTEPLQSVDPLANPFPDDVKQKVNSDEETVELAQSNDSPTTGMEQVAPPTSPSEGESQSTETPYTGLALEGDLFLKTKVPAPAEPSTEELPMLPDLPASEPETKSQLALAPAMPELPLLPAPGEISDLSKTKKDEMKETEVTAKAPVESNPFAKSMEKAAGNSTEPKVAVETKLRAPKFPEPKLTQSKESPQLQAPKLEAPQASETKVAQSPEKPKASGRQSKMELIASRKGMTGLKGFCPVKLRDSRDLVDVNDEFSATFNDKEYRFSSNEALQAFIANPEKYAPAIHGSDVIHLSLTGEEQEGSLDHAVWYKGRLYLFTSVETMETFVAAPSSHLTAL
ncbi:hypothetical protein [Thalassoglobus sp.]|uniref:hypothetical protein n=1 Tax=Thalassoglobus sp. TaxID=2795869 RepID=UPI003AA7C032